MLFPVVGKDGCFKDRTDVRGIVRPVVQYEDVVQLVGFGKNGAQGVSVEAFENATVLRGDLFFKAEDGGDHLFVVLVRFGEAGLQGEDQVLQLHLKAGLEMDAFQFLLFTLFPASERRGRFSLIAVFLLVALEIKLVGVGRGLRGGLKVFDGPSVDAGVASAHFFAHGLDGLQHFLYLGVGERFAVLRQDRRGKNREGEAEKNKSSHSARYTGGLGGARGPKLIFLIKNLCRTSGYVRDSSVDLDEIRRQIDAVDEKLIALLNERAELVHKVGVIKKKDGLEIYAPEREEQLLQSLIAKGEGGRLPENSIRAIYREIMSAALALEEDLAIAYLGPEGTWTHQAAIQKFGASVAYKPLPNFAEVFDRVARRKADYGVVPIENSTEGAVNHTLDLFADSPLKICAQVQLRIENSLMARCPRESITRIYSHPQVFGQCRNWLHLHFPTTDQVEVSSTTRAAQLAAEEENTAALGGTLGAEIYGLDVLETSIQDSATNTTRFLVLGHKTCPVTGNDRTSIMFAVRDQPGSLLHALKPFHECDINMSKIESRPSKRKDWEYFFFVDLKGHCEDGEIVEALDELAKHCSFLKVLGSYPDTGVID